MTARLVCCDHCDAITRVDTPRDARAALTAGWRARHTNTIQAAVCPDHLGRWDR